MAREHEQSADIGAVRPEFSGEQGPVQVSCFSQALATWCVLLLLLAGAGVLGWALFLEFEVWKLLLVIAVTGGLLVMGLWPALRAIWAFRIGPEGITVVRTFGRQEIPWPQVKGIGFSRTYEEALLEPVLGLPILRWWYRTLDIYLANGKHIQGIIGKRGRLTVAAAVRGLLPEKRAE